MYLNRTLYCITDFLHKKTRITEQILRIKKPRTRQYRAKEKEVDENKNLFRCAYSITEHKCTCKKILRML